MTPTDNSKKTPRLSRRAVIATGSVAVAAFTGCLGSDDGDESDDGSDPPTGDDAQSGPVPFVENPPDGVYKPTHREPFVMEPVVEAGEYALLPHFTYAHRFWRVEGTETVEVFPTVDDSAHLMIAFWDRQTGELLPVDAGGTMEIRHDGETVETVTPWPMLAQSMGFHFGDNVPLPEDGTYTVEVTLNPIAVRKTGAFAGRFEESETATFEFEWSRELLEQLRNDIEFLPEDEWGERGAIEPMNHGGHGDAPSPGLPPADAYPGTALGTHESGDAAVVVRYLSESRLAEEKGYLLVSPRTPYNRIPLPDMSLSVSGVTALDTDASLTQTLDDELGLHYGLAVTLSPGETFELGVDTPPQSARHQGYETAFLEMEPLEIEVPER